MQDKLLMTGLSSIQIDPEWTRNAQFFVAALYEKINGAYAQVNRIREQMAQDNANASAQQAAIRSDTANYRSRVMSSVAHSRSAALDHSSQQFALYIGDQAIYKDPSTGEHVQMSSGYDHVWPRRPAIPVTMSQRTLRPTTPMVTSAVPAGRRCKWSISGMASYLEQQLAFRKEKAKE